MDRRYLALRIVGIFYKVLGTIVAATTLLLVIGVCGTSFLGGAAIDSFARQFGGDTSFAGMLGSVLGGLIISGLFIIYGGGLALTLFAVGEGVSLLIAMEENTRATAFFMEKQAEQASKIPGPTTSTVVSESSETLIK